MIYNPISVYPQPLNVTTLPRYCVMWCLDVPRLLRLIVFREKVWKYRKMFVSLQR